MGENPALVTTAGGNCSLDETKRTYFSARTRYALNYSLAEWYGKREWAIGSPSILAQHTGVNATQGKSPLPWPRYEHETQPRIILPS